MRCLACDGEVRWCTRSATDAGVWLGLVVAVVIRATGRLRLTAALAAKAYGRRL
jgi:hypothetical protein